MLKTPIDRACLSGFLLLQHSQELLHLFEFGGVARSAPLVAPIVLRGTGGGSPASAPLPVLLRWFHLTPSAAVSACFRRDRVAFAVRVYRERFIAIFRLFRL